MSDDNTLKFILVAIGFSLGGLIFDGFKVGEPEMHTEKHGCEYVEESKCIQVWVNEEVAPK